MIIPLMAAELFGLRVLGRLMGVVLTADGVAEAVVPMLVAGLRDRTGSYGAGFGLLAGLAVLGAVAVALLPKAEARDTLPPGAVGRALSSKTRPEDPIQDHRERVAYVCRWPVEGTQTS